MVMGSAFKFPAATRIGDTKMPEGQVQQETFDQRLDRIKKQVLDMKELELLGKGLSPESGGTAQDAGFKVTGGINMGNYDVQAREREMREELERSREEKDNQLTQLNEELQKSRAENQNMVITSALKEVGEKFGAGLLALDKKIEAYGKGAEGSSIERVISEFEALTKLAGRFGSLAPQGTPATGDPLYLLKVEEIKLQAAREERKFQVELEQIKRQNQVDMMKFNVETEFKREELKMKRDNIAMLAKAPEILGGAIAQGLMRMSAGGDVAEQPAARVAQRAAAPPPQESTGKKITAGTGEAGVVECPECHDPMAVGPDATEIICAGCGSRYPIQRSVDA